MSPSQAAVDMAAKVYDSILIALPEAVADFESKWSAWQAQTDLSTLDMCTRADEYETLKKLGPKIIPFVVHKLARDTEKNSCGVFLYNAVEADGQYRLNPEEALDSPETLERYGQQIVELNYHRSITYEERVGRWKKYCSERRTCETLAICTVCDEYEDLVEMGPSIITNVMVDYVNSRGGYWYELLHEILHGHQMGAYMVQRPVLFEQYCAFFNWGDHAQAPKYVPTEWDEFILDRKAGPEVQEHFRRVGREV